MQKGIPLLRRHRHHRDYVRLSCRRARPQEHHRARPPVFSGPHARDAAYCAAGKLLVPIGTHRQLVRCRHGALLSAHASRLVQGNSSRRSRMRRILTTLPGGPLSNRRISRHGARHRKRHCRRIHRPLLRAPQKEGQPPRRGYVLATRHDAALPNCDSFRRGCSYSR